MLSSSKPDRSETKFAARLDVLAERLDTLASTVATTASAMAKKDGEIAALRKELDARDERLADFVTRARATAGATELIELREAVAALAADRAQGSGATPGQLDDLVAKIGLLGQRVETLSATVSTTAAGLAGKEGEIAAIRRQLDSAPAATAVTTTAAPDPAVVQRVGDLAAEVTGTRQNLNALAAEVGALRLLVEQRAAESEQRAAEAPRPSEELREMLVALRTKVEELTGMRGSGVTEEQLERRVAHVDTGVSRLSERLDTLGSTVESAVASLSDKEHELAALHRHFTESSTRIEGIVGDIRDALAAIPDLDATNIDDLASRADRLGERIDAFESSARDLADVRERAVADLAHRLDAVEQQLDTVTSEVARAKTLWPLALRSLEARLDDVGGGDRTALGTLPAQEPVEEPERSPDADLVASLRDSLQAMETVAAEMERGSDAFGAAEEEEAVRTQGAVAAGGGTVVPLRSDS